MMEARSISLVFSTFWILLLAFLCETLMAQGTVSEESRVIKVGLLIEDSTFAAARYGAELAVKQINEQGRLKGYTLELLTRSMNGPWGKGSKQAVDLIFDEEVWALIGSSDGRNAHLVEQVIAKTNVVFLSAWSADPTLSKAYVPHFFNCVPNSEQQAEAILADLHEKRRMDQWALITSNGYDAEQASLSLLKHEMVKENQPIAHLFCQSSKDFELIAGEIEKKDLQAAVVICERKISMELIRHLRSQSPDLPIYIELMSHGDLESRAAYSYDAVQIIASAIERSGYNLSDLRAAVSDTEYSGKTGAIQFDDRGNRKGLPELIEIDTQIFSIGKR